MKFCWSKCSLKMKIDSSHSMIIIIIIIKWRKLIKCKLWIYDSHAVEKEKKKGTKGAFQTYLFRNTKFLYWISWLKVFSIPSTVSIILRMAFHYCSFNTEECRILNKWGKNPLNASIQLRCILELNSNEFEQRQRGDDNMRFESWMHIRHCESNAFEHFECFKRWIV